jgi:hypothetical protein
VSKLVIVQVLSFALGEAEQEHRLGTPPISNYGPQATALALAWSSHTLLDEPAAEIGISKSSLCSSHRLQKRLVGDSCPALKTGEGLELI